ncbi:MAG: saccharopine dehydrogenase C-terminal domain-containing protein [Ferruginibacter sp.]
MQIAILGAGMVGRAIAIDLAFRFTVTSFDLSNQSLQELTKKAPGIKTIQADLSDFNRYPEWLSDFDMVVSAVPGFMGYRALEAIIRSGKTVVDISFFPEDALQLHQMAADAGVTAIVDCGVAPGLSNLVLGYCDSIMKVDSFECMVGGLPKVRTWPFAYKAPFSPIDVLEEYTRPARYVENGHIITKPALSDPELVDFEDIGTLQSFNTDGLRSILYTMKHIPNLKEKTLRYPGHIDMISALQKAGFFDTTERNIRGNMIRPIDMTASVLFDQWKLNEEDDEFTIMKMIVIGMEVSESRTLEYLLYDERDRSSGISSMSRTTGYTCTAAVNMLADAVFTDKGVYPPEIIGRRQGCFDYVLHYLSKRNIRLRTRKW